MSRFPHLLAALALAAASVLTYADTVLLNASYDVARDVFKDYNPLFQKYWKQKAGEVVEVNTKPLLECIAEGVTPVISSMIMKH